MSISAAILSFPKPAYHYSAQTGLVKYVFADEYFMEDKTARQNEEYNKYVVTSFPHMVTFIRRQFQRICHDFGIKYKDYDDISKIARDYIDFCKTVGYVEGQPIKRTEDEVLAITTKTAGYDEKIEKWLSVFLTFLSTKQENNNFIGDNEASHADLMFNIAVYIMTAREVVLYLCDNYLLIEKIKQALDCIHQFMMDDLSVEQIAELASLRKETANLMKMIQYNVDDVEDLKTFLPSDANRFFMKYPNNVFSKHINELKKNKQYDPEKYAAVNFVGKPIVVDDEGTEYKPMFNMFAMPLVSTINKTTDAELREEIEYDHAWSTWIVKIKDELAKYPEELSRYVGFVKPDEYIHINPIFRYK